MSTSLSSRPTDIAAALDAIESRDAVRKIKASYMQGLDDRRRGAVAEIFWQDAVWESLPDRAPEGHQSASTGGQIVGRDAIAQSFVDAAAAMSFTAHFLTNEDITVDGDYAVGRWKLLQACTSTGGRAFWQAGVYTDDFERRDGVWKISHLRLAMDFRTPFDQGWAIERMWELPG
ncbi:nuclear transport factor 2 family protein [Mycolicibacterium sp. 050158]|uniref:nuclear transport factor 2 family protein n=1 Tax=Mycolicibacterium sp. 050158 TaxID=3090602 RepID=UPI00299E4085|nr:nuclear transport factor 2 family protein [Mycolicibacterium sp. 050158]MDX1888119.1 nuclear transport factor 2 family protein [Mycolicibacterium sp. 050158]